MARDSNLTSQLEGLQTILVYVKLVPNIKNSLLFLADELVQKCGLTKQKSGELVHQIVVELMSRDNEGLLLLYIIKQALPNLPLNENVGKNLVSGMNKTLSHSIAEVRNNSLLLASEVFCYVTDDLTTFVKNLDLKPLQIKEFTEILENKEKLCPK